LRPFIKDVRTENLPSPLVRTASSPLFLQTHHNFRKILNSLQQKFGRPHLKPPLPSPHWINPLIAVVQATFMNGPLYPWRSIITYMCLFFGIALFPHGNNRFSKPPRAAFSHSASVGKRFPAHLQYSVASFHDTCSTGWLYLKEKKEIKRN